MGENMYGKRIFKKSLKPGIYLRMLSVPENIITILIAVVLTVIIYYSKWYSAGTSMNPYMMALVYTPFYIFCQMRVIIPSILYITIRTKNTDRLKVMLLATILSALLWAGFLSLADSIIWNSLSFSKFILCFLYFMTISSVMQVIYNYTKNKVICFSITLVIFFTDYYLSFFGTFMRFRGVILYTAFGMNSFWKSCSILLLLNLILWILQIYLYYFNMDLPE